MNTELNIVARRIFNRLDVDISDRRGLGNEWDQISPNVKNVEIRRAWGQIFTEEIEKHTSELQARVKRLEEAGDGIVKLANDYTVLLKAFQHTEMMEDAIDQIERWNEAKESKP